MMEEKDGDGEFLTPRSYLERELEIVAQRHFTLKKLLLKLSFVAEMDLFMKDPQVRYDRNKCPLLFRSHVRATESPLFPRDTENEIMILESFIDKLPTIQMYLKRGTKKDLQAEVRNSICNAWMSILLTKEEIEYKETPKSEDEGEDEWFFYIPDEEGDAEEASRQKEEEEENEEDNGESEDMELNEKQFDKRLAARRARRKVAASAMSTFMEVLASRGVEDFFEVLSKVESYKQLPDEYRHPFRKVFSVLSLTLLDSYSQEKNRQKANKLIGMVPGWLLALVFKISNPFKLATFGARMSVKVKLFSGLSLFQTILRIYCDLPKTEQLLSEIDLPKSAKKFIVNAIEKQRSEEDILKAKELSSCNVKSCKKFVELEIRRREKQDLVDYGSTEDMKFVLLDFFPILGKPILDLYGSTGFGGLIKDVMNTLTQLMELIELPKTTNGREKKIDECLERFESLVFLYIKDMSLNERPVLEVLLRWLKDSYHGGPEILSMDSLLAWLKNEEQEALWKEVDRATNHFLLGGHFSQIITDLPTVNSLVKPFQQLISQHIPPPERSVTVPNMHHKFYVHDDHGASAPVLEARKSGSGTLSKSGEKKLSSGEIERKRSPTITKIFGRKSSTSVTQRRGTLTLSPRRSKQTPVDTSGNNNSNNNDEKTDE